MTIFIVSLMKFDGLPSTNLTVAKYLAKENNVYYIENPLSIKDYIKIDKNSKAYLARTSAYKFSSTGELEQKIKELNLLVSLPVFPIGFLPKGIIYNTFRTINENIIASRIKRVIKKKDIKDYIFINFYNVHTPRLHKKLKAKLNVYYCVDPIPDYDRKHGLNDESILIKNSDLIICTSKALYNEKKQINPNTFFVPNAADLVNEIDIRTIQPHVGLTDIPRPIVGYIGAIERRIDYALMKNVIARSPNISFVFTGPVHREFVPDWFFHQPNIFFFPPVDYKEVPLMIKGFDVCVIPFKKDDISNTIFPLKLFEYLGIGKPVIITDFNPDLTDVLGDNISIASNEKEFSEAIKDALTNNSFKDIAKRIKKAKDNTWETRIESIYKILATHVRDNTAAINPGEALPNLDQEKDLKIGA